VIPFAVKHTVKHKIHFTIVGHTMKGTVGDQHDVTSIDSESFFVNLHNASALHKKVNFFLASMAVSPGALPSIEFGAAEY
jgi:hypothetical protein